MNEQDRSGQARPPELAPSGPASTYGTALRLAASLAAVPTAVVVTSSAQELRIRAAVGDDAPEVVSGSPLLLQAWATGKPVFSADAAQLRALFGDAARPWVWCAVVPFGAGGDEGALLLIDTVARTLDDAQIGRLTLLGGVLAEVTQLARAAVAHDEHDLQGFFRFADHATNGFAVYRFVDGRPQVEYINASAAARLRASVEQFSQNPGLLFEDPGNAALGVEVLARVRRGDTASHETQVHALDGTSYWVELAAWPLPADGDAERVLIIVTDITEQRSTNEHLRLLSRAIDEAVDFFSISDMTPASEGGPLIRYANPALLHLTGYTSDELYGRS
ncbi:MAG: PAS domain-containing protein [Vulcanimicrobiaceae bacterium]